MEELLDTEAEGGGGDGDGDGGEEVDTSTYRGRVRDLRLSRKEG